MEGDDVHLEIFQQWLNNTVFATQEMQYPFS